MNGAQLHLALNHLPVITSWISLGILAWGWLGKNSEIKKVGLSLAVITGAFAVVAFLTGEPAEHILKQLPDFPRDLVHEHEEAGEAAMIVSILGGISALVALVFSKTKQKIASYAFLAAFVFVLLSATAFIRTSHLGGIIRHTEIRPAS